MRPVFLNLRWLKPSVALNLQSSFGSNSTRYHAPYSTANYVCTTNNRCMHTFHPLSTRVTDPALVNANIDEMSQEFKETMWDDVSRTIREKYSRWGSDFVELYLGAMSANKMGKGKKWYPTRAAIISYSYLAELQQNDTEHKRKLAYILTLCIEMAGRSFTINDDIMDKSEIRHGRPCLHIVKGIPQAQLESTLLLAGAFDILKWYFQNEQSYPKILEAFNQMLSAAGYGQALEDFVSKFKKADTFTWDLYEAISSHKFGYCELVYQSQAVMHLVGIADAEKISEKIKPILLDIGLLYQMLNDYRDIYCDSSSLPGQSVGEDIQNNRCSWLIVVALQNASVKEKKVLLEFYGKPGEGNAQVVKRIYDAVGLKNWYETYKQKLYHDIVHRIRQIPTTEVPHLLLFDMMNECLATLKFV